MSWFGTDVVALGCILGGAAVSGAATFTMLDGHEYLQPDCGVEAIATSPRIAISRGGRAKTIVVAPNVRVHTLRDCVSELDGVVEVHLDSHLRHLDAQLEQLDHALELQFQHFEGQLEGKIQQEMEARLHFEEAMSQLEEARWKVVVEKSERGG